MANVTVNPILPNSIVAPPTKYDGCALGILCPIMTDRHCHFEGPIPVKTQFVPPFEVAFRYQIRDGSGPIILCLYVWVTVGDPK